MVVNELRGEKIDIVPFSDDHADFVAKALSPAKVKEVRIDEDTGTAEVIVPDYQLSLAIGKEGQNARLAARLTGWRVDIKSESQLAEEEAYGSPGLGRGRVGRRSRDRRAGVAAGRGRRGHVGRAVDAGRRRPGRRAMRPAPARGGGIRCSGRYGAGRDPKQVRGTPTRSTASRRRRTPTKASRPPPIPSPLQGADPLFVRSGRIARG